MKEKEKRKLCVILILLLFFFLYRIFSEENLILKFSRYSFYDKWLLDCTSSLNKYISQHLVIRDLSLLLASNTFDILMISFLFYFIKYGNCLRAAVSLSMFYFCRAIIQKLFLLPYYENYLFEYPGFLSFVVPFYRAADFFYSGHCGCSLILTLTFRDLKMPFYFYFGIVVTALNAVVMSAITRAHYSIDIIFGMFVAFYFYNVSEKIIKMFSKNDVREDNTDVNNSIDSISVNDNAIN